MTTYPSTSTYPAHLRDQDTSTETQVDTSVVVQKRVRNIRVVPEQKGRGFRHAVIGVAAEAAVAMLLFGNASSVPSEGRYVGSRVARTFSQSAADTSMDPFGVAGISVAFLRGDMQGFVAWVHEHYGALGNILDREKDSINSVADLLAVIDNFTAGPTVQGPSAGLPPHLHLFKADSSTAMEIQSLIPVQAHSLLQVAIARAREEVFEDGMASEFSRVLSGAIETYGTAAVWSIDLLIREKAATVEVASEALRQIGLNHDRPSHGARLALLTRYLRSEDARLRDAAVLGLSFLDDPSAVPSLRSALKKEQSVVLRENIQQVLDEIGETERWPRT